MYLNLGCGGNRPSDSNWVNIDNLHAIFPDLNAPERKNMDAEPNYKNADLTKGIPFPDDSVDGIVCSHMIEHFDCFNTINFLKDCFRSLKPGGVLRLSVPDPEKFHRLTIAGCTDWGEPNNGGSKSFMEYALFFAMEAPGGHHQVLGKDSVFCLLWMAGFRNYFESSYSNSTKSGLATLDNRPVFSLFIEAVK
jgi:predicted SAM-dependent methyltransferase